MFENYSLADLLANIYKNFKKNIIIAAVAFLIVLLPFVIKAVQPKEEAQTVQGANYSTYIVYNVASDRAYVGEKGEKLEPYSDFYNKLINANLNGAYIFEDADEELLNKISSDLSIDKVQLRNTDSNYWYGKIEVGSSAENGTVSVRILTSSLDFNNLVEKKVDELVEESKQYLENVSIEKINTFATEAEIENDTTDEITVDNKVINKGTIVKGAVLGIIFALFLVLFINFVVYIFNPTMNGVSAFEKYNINFIYDFNNADDLLEVIKFIEDSEGEITFVTTSDKIKKSFDKKLAKNGIENKFNIVNENDTHSVIAAEKIVFVEEYGVTHYRKFEKALRQAKNFGKEVVGVISMPL